MFVLWLLKEPTVIFSFIEMPQSRLAYLNTLRMFAERQCKRFVLSEYLWVQGWERVCFGDIFVSQRSVDRRTKCLPPRQAQLPLSGQMTGVRVFLLVLEARAKFLRLENCTAKY